MAMPEWIQRKQAEARVNRQRSIAEAQKAAAEVRSAMVEEKPLRERMGRALNRVLTEHYYLGEYRNFREWFDAQEFNFSYATGWRFIKDVVGIKSSHGEKTSNKKPPSWEKAIERAIKLVQAEYAADPDPAYDKAVKRLREALALCRGGAHA